MKLSEEELARRQTHVDNWRNQGIPMRQYCQQAGLNYNCFKHWCYRWKKEKGLLPPKKEEVGEFIPVKVNTRVNQAQHQTRLATSPIPSIARFELSLLFGFIRLQIR